MQELVSVIIPLYNCERYISKTIKSVVRQTYNNVEVIIIDDCSCDGSCNVVTKWINSDHRIQLVKNDENMGMMRTVNKGLEICKGTYGIILGCDDILPEDYLVNMIECMSKTCVFSFCNPYYIDENDNIIGLYRNNIKEYMSKKSLNDALAFSCVIPSTGLVVRLEALKKIGGYPIAYKNYGEWMVWIKLLALGDFCFCENVHSLYRVRTGNLTASFNKNELLERYWEECRVLAKNSLELSYWAKAKWHYNKLVKSIKRKKHVFENKKNNQQNKECTCK